MCSFKQWLQRELERGKLEEKQFRDLFAISKKGSGANRVPTACGIGGRRARLLCPFRWDPKSGKGTRILEMGPISLKGTHILQGDQWPSGAGVRRQALSLRGYPAQGSAVL
jgi:hypothetical protein